MPARPQRFCTKRVLLRLEKNTIKVKAVEVKVPRVLAPTLVIFVAQIHLLSQKSFAEDEDVLKVTTT
jgi:hypothetical protein